MSSWGWRITEPGILERILDMAKEARAVSVWFDVSLDQVVFSRVSLAEEEAWDVAVAEREKFERSG